MTAPKRQRKTKPKPVTIPERDLLLVIQHMVRFPFAKICRHAVAGELLDLLERNGFTRKLDPLAKALVQSDDEMAERILAELLNTHHVGPIRAAAKQEGWELVGNYGTKRVRKADK